ncbi:hypothetical protein [Mycobacterium sp. UM_CSW]|uniref:hypothetical protein n=1 Tax=Mycobacterium sp. UM_CSW TaxID=1370119 RepID=UPI001267CC34|nr:hypothetical protein [Mycobacterium sp. UM_CSW]
MLRPVLTSAATVVAISGTALSAAPATMADPTELSAADQSAIADTIKSWMLEPRCDLMTREFLSEQVLHFFEGDPVKQCDYYKSVFVPKQYGRNDIRVDDIKGNATEATAVCGDFQTNVATNYTLVNNGTGWKIAKAA